MPEVRAWQIDTVFLVVLQWQRQELLNFILGQEDIPFLRTRAWPNAHLAITKDNGEHESMLESNTWQLSFVGNCTICQTTHFVFEFLKSYTFTHAQHRLRKNIQVFRDVEICFCVLKILL